MGEPVFEFIFKLFQDVSLIKKKQAVKLVHKFMGEDATFRKDLPALKVKTDVIVFSQRK